MLSKVDFSEIRAPEDSGSSSTPYSGPIQDEVAEVDRLLTSAELQKKLPAFRNPALYDLAHTTFPRL